MSAEQSPAATGIADERASSPADAAVNGVNGDASDGENNAQTLSGKVAEDEEDDAGDDLFGDEDDEGDAGDAEKPAYV